MGVAGECQSKLEIGWNILDLGIGRYVSVLQTVGKPTGLLGRLVNVVVVAALLKASFKVGAEAGELWQASERLNDLERAAEGLNDPMKLYQDLRSQLLIQAEAMRALRAGLTGNCQAEAPEVIDPLASPRISPLAGREQFRRRVSTS